MPAKGLQSVKRACGQKSSEHGRSDEPKDQLGGIENRNRAERCAKILILLAGATGLEPATFGVTGRRSNQLSYAPAGADGN
jgi:hypothetical protein